jgi:hypothetical protein
MNADAQLHNTVIGPYATVGNNVTNSMALGYFTGSIANDEVSIGNTTVSSIGGWEDWTNFSDGRYKRHIREDIPGLAFILHLRPVSYQLDLEQIENHISAVTGRTESASPRYQHPEAYADKSNRRFTGLLAQEVESVSQQLGFEFSGVDHPGNENDFYGLRYATFVVPLVKAVQEQQVMLEDQTKQIMELNGKLESALQRLTELESRFKSK